MTPEQKARSRIDGQLEQADLPDPDVFAQELADDLQTALEQFQSIAAALKKPNFESL